MLPMVQPEPVLFKCGVQSVNTAVSPPTTLPPSLTPESDVDELVDIFFDVDVAATTYPRNESCDLQLGDTWRGMQGKMSVTAPDKKIRKKSDKPQSQINKCYNEKKRREQENETINQLEELLGTCLAEVKQPDKNGIVREATRQIEEVLQRRRECPGECPLRATHALSPVQAGEVSSTQPQPPCTGLHITELTILIEALKHYTGSLGWILLEINSKGEIECVTENIKDLILRDRTELYKKSIFSLLHVKDHAKLRPLLKSIQNFNGNTGERVKFQAIEASLIVKNSVGTDSSVVEAVIHAAPVRGTASEEAGSVMCVIRRCEDASAALTPVGGGPPAITAGKQADHVVFRLDRNYSILSCDLKGVENFANCPVSLVGTRYLDLVESCDRGIVSAHLAEAACLPAPPAVSEPFRLRLLPDRPPLRFSAHSRLFRAKPGTREPDFIMSTHHVLGDDGDDGPDNDTRSNGEPYLMNDFDLEPWTSTLLSDISDASKDRNDSSAGESSSAPRTPATPSEPPPQLLQQHSQQQSHQPHPQPQHSQQQHSQQQHSQQQHTQQQHSQQQHSQQQHSQQQHSQQQHSQQQHSQQQHLQQHQHPQQQQQHEEPTRLRSILEKHTGKNHILIGILRQEDEEGGGGGETSAPPTPHTPHTPHTPQAPLTPHTPAAAHSPAHRRGSHAPLASHVQQASQHPHAGPSSHSHQQHNPLVRGQILNDNTDSEGEEARCGAGSGVGGGQRVAAHQSVLSQLLQPTNNGSANNGRADNVEASYLEKMTAQKRKFEEAKGIATNPKRATPENQQVSSSAVQTAQVPVTSASPATSGGGMSPLCQKNQILVSLLAREQSTPTTPPQLTNPSVRPYPPRARLPQHPSAPHHATHPTHAQRHHSALSDILTGNNHRIGTVNGGTVPGASGGGSHLQIMLQQGGTPARYPPPHYAPRYAQPHHQPSQQHNASIRTPGGTGGGNGGGGGTSSNAGGGGTSSGDCEVPTDKTLSEILDDVLATMPDTDRPAPELNMRQRQEIEDRSAAVKAITASLMQCEKHPVVSSPGIPPVYSVQSPGPCPMPAAQSALYPPRAPVSIAEQHARLLHMQRSQQMLVSPEAAEQPQSDLGSTINALSETPPNVTLLPRGDYHPSIYQTNQIGSNYSTIKITSSQQNPMLSRQLSVGGSGYVHGASHAAALHTPATQPYLRAPRPHLVGGYYEEGGAGDCGEYARCTPLPPHAPHPPHLPHPYRSPGQMQCPGNGSPGVAGGGGTSEYVRNELRAVVGARSARPDLHPMQPDMDSLMSFDIAPPGGGGVVGGRAAATSSSWESQQSTPNTTEAGSVEQAAAGGDGETAGAGGGVSGAAPTAKASLLQKLLSQ